MCPQQTDEPGPLSVSSRGSAASCRQNAVKTHHRQVQKRLPLAKELAGEVGLVAIETLKLILDVPKSAAAPTDMADAS